MKAMFGQINLFMRMVGNMKTFKVIFTFMIFLTLVMSIPFVSSMGLSEPTVGLRLLRGDIADFEFTIRAVTDQNDIECTYSISGMDPLLINFEEDTTITIKAGSYRKIYGSVSVPANAEIKRYSGGLVVSCKPLVEPGEVTGSIVNRVMNAGFSVNVVEKLEERRVREAPKHLPAPTYNLFLIATMIIIIVLVIVGYVWSERKK